MAEIYLRGDITGVISMPDTQKVRFFILLRDEKDRIQQMNRTTAFQEELKHQYGMSFTGYICTNTVKLIELRQICAALTDYDNSNLTAREHIVRLDASELAKTTESGNIGTEEGKKDNETGVSPMPSLTGGDISEDLNADDSFMRTAFWNECITNGREALLNKDEASARRQARMQLQNMMQRMPDKRGLLQFQQAVRQVAYSLLTELHLHFEQKWIEQLQLLEKKSADSMPDMMAWADCMITALLETMNKGIEEEDPAVLIRNYIDKHYQEKITRENIAYEMHLSGGYAARLFKDKYGISINEYVQQVRLERARTLLVTTELTSSEIADTVGFESNAYFTTCFRKAFGETPKAYRERK